MDLKISKETRDIIIEHILTMEDAVLETTMPMLDSGLIREHAKLGNDAARLFACRGVLELLEVSDG